MTSLVVFISFAFSVISGLLPGIWIGDYEVSKDRVNVEEGEQRIIQLMGLHAIICTALILPSIIAFKEKPPSPPSFTAEQKREEFFKSLKVIVKNKNYILMMVNYSLLCGGFIALSSILSYITHPFGFNPKSLGLAILSLFVFGMIGSFLLGRLFRKNP